MKVIILAAGRGSRLHPYTEDCPKCLTEIGGMTLLARQLAVLEAAEIDDITIVSGYRGKMLDVPGTRRIENSRWETTNMVESLFAAEAEFGDDLIVSYSDIIYEPRVLAALLDSPSDISVVVDRAWLAYWEMRFENPLEDAESLRLDGTGRITDIGGKVADLGEIEAQYIGLMRFRGDGIAALRTAKAAMGDQGRPWMRSRSLENAFMTDLLMELILTGETVHAVPVDGGWLEIDTVKDYEKAAAMFADGSIRKFYDPDSLQAVLP